MTIKKILKRDRLLAEKFFKYQLPNSFKKVGWILFIAAFVGNFIAKGLLGTEEFDLIIRAVTKYLILIGLLIVSLSREKIEDEYIKSLRMQSYMFAFIVGVVQSLVFPFIAYAAENLFSSGAPFEEAGDFFILWILLFCQIMYFQVLKRCAND